MYVFGEKHDGAMTEQFAKDLLSKAREKSRALQQVPLAEIAEIAQRVGNLWRGETPYWKQATEILRSELAFSGPMIEQMLAVIPRIFSERELRERVAGELGSFEAFDDFQPARAANLRVRAQPVGLVFQALAGNVFLSSLDALLSTLITRNIPILKLSHRHRLFPELFADSFREADPGRRLCDKFAFIHFGHEDREVLKRFKESVDAIVVWGGEEAVRAYKEDLPVGVRFLEHGPKISFQVLEKETLREIGMDAIAERIAREICLWDQAACASPQNLFVEEGVEIGPLMQAIAKAMEKPSWPRGRIEPDEQVEILKETFHAKLSTLVEGGRFIEGKDFLLHFDPRPGLRPSPLNRTLILKTFHDEISLAEALLPFRHYLQSCSLAVAEGRRARMESALSEVGVTRFADLGGILEGKAGAPHDGAFPLTELVRFVSQERESGAVAFINRAIGRVPYYRRIRNGLPIRRIEELPLLESEALRAYSPADGAEFSNGEKTGGHFFASGGSTGEPKTIFYSERELERVGELLGQGFRLQGIAPGMRVANLFVAGNLWSSFLAVDRALSKISAHVLPIGGHASSASILEFLRRFRPEAVIGLPTRLAGLAAEGVAAGLKIEVPLVFTAGEPLSLPARRALSTRWKVSRFCSAGYASVDAGPVGYQCGQGKPDEYHVHSDAIYLEEIEGEAVVTSLVKECMPILRLRTGDWIEWSSASPCPCGSPDRRFFLRGRLDRAISFRGGRLLLDEIERAMEDCGVECLAYQCVVSHPVRECRFPRLTLRIETASSGHLKELAPLPSRIYENARDLHQKLSLPEFCACLKIQTLRPGEITRESATRKVPFLVDERTLAGPGSMNCNCEKGETL